MVAVKKKTESFCCNVDFKSRFKSVAVTASNYPHIVFVAAVQRLVITATAVESR